MATDSLISYQKWFPWLHLFQAIPLAASMRQLIVAVGAVCALGAGHMVIDWFRVAKGENESAQPSRHALPIDPVVEINMRLVGSPHFTLTPNLADNCIQPWSDVVRSLVEVLDRERDTGDRWIAAARCLWSFAAWSFFGLILCRLAARRIALDEDGSFRKSAQFGMSRWRNAIVSSLLPTAAAALLLLIAILAALPGRLPWIGPMVVMIVSPIVLLFSLVSALLIVATSIGWPLMVAAIAYEDCDGFGGLSRSYSLWTGRPWQFVWYWIVAGIAGTLSMFIIGWLGTCTLNVAVFVFRSGMGGDPDVRRMAQSSAEFLIGSCLSAYGISFFWTSATIIYALLRSSVDHVPMSVVSPEDDERSVRDPLPVVGMPAVGQEG